MEKLIFLEIFLLPCILEDRIPVWKNAVGKLLKIEFMPYGFWQTIPYNKLKMKLNSFFISNDNHHSTRILAIL